MSDGPMYLAGARQVELPEKLKPVVDVVLWNLIDNGFRVIDPQGRDCRLDILGAGDPKLRMGAVIASLRHGL